MAQEKISVYNIADLKNTSDDAIPNYLNSLGFVQSHWLADVRLALGYGAFAVAGLCFYWDYKLGFEATKYYSAAAVAVYMALNTVLAFWVKYVEKSTVYVGTSPAGEVISIATSAEKYIPVYHVTVTTQQAPGAAPQVEKFSRPFCEWFDGAGRFIALPFQTMFASQVAAVGRVDTARAAPAVPAAPAEVATEIVYSAETLELLSAATEAGASANGAVATGSNQKKGGKRRKV